MTEQRRRWVTPDGGEWEFYQDDVMPWVMFTELSSGRYVTGMLAERLPEDASDELLTATLKEVWKRHGGPSGVQRQPRNQMTERRRR